MTLNSKLTETLESIGVAFDEFKRRNGETLDEYKARFAELTERLEDLESRQRSPGKTAGPNSGAREHRQRWEKWIRNPGNDQAKGELHEIEHRLGLDRKQVTVGSGAAGGFAVPEEIARQIEEFELEYSPVRNLVRVLQSQTGDFKLLADLKGATSGWTGESGSRTATNTPQLREIVPTFGEVYALPSCSEWSLDDIFFNVGEWIARSCAEAFAVQEEDAVLRGDGANKPTGMLNTTPTTVDDFASPLRAAAAYQYVPCVSTQSPAVAEITADALIDIVYKLRSRYRSGASWVMNSQTAAAVCKLRDNLGRFLWVESLVSGQPPRLLGYPVFTVEGMDDIGTNQFPVAFGAWQRAYALVDRVDLRILRDPYSTPGFVRFYVRKRVGGHVWVNDAAKFLRTTLA
jgi:HK97 family phage major capsid protein